MTPVKEQEQLLERSSRNSHKHYSIQQPHYQSYQLPATSHPITSPTVHDNVQIISGSAARPLHSPTVQPRTDQSMANLMNSAGIQVTIDNARNSTTSRPTSKLKHFANLAQSIKNEDEFPMPAQPMAASVQNYSSEKKDRCELLSQQYFVTGAPAALSRNFNNHHYTSSSVQQQPHYST